MVWITNDNKPRRPTLAEAFQIDYSGPFLPLSKHGV